MSYEMISDLSFAPQRPVSGPPPAVLWGDLNMLRCFVGRDIPTVIVATDPDDVTLKSRYCQTKKIVASPSNPEQALFDLESIGQSFTERPVLFYGNDSTLLFISRHRERLAKSFRFRLPSADLIEKLVDKGGFSRLARRHNLPVPKTIGSDGVHRVEDIVERVGLPCLFKPAEHTGWHTARASEGKTPSKAIVAETLDDLRRAYCEVQKYTDKFVIQQYVAGDEASIYSYHAYVGDSGRPLGHFLGRKIRTYPREAGVSTFLELVVYPELAELGQDVARCLGLVGPVKMDFKRDPATGRLYLLEINARFTLWNYLGATCGVNLPKIAYADLVGERCVPPKGYDTNVRWLSFGNDLRSFLREYKASGALSWSDWLGSYRRRLVFDVFSWRDPAPLGAALTQYGRALTNRLLRAER